VVLHDADAASCLLADRLRAARPARVVTAALRPRQAAATRRLPRHDAGTVPDRWLDQLTDLTGEERAWLRHGWTPLVELSPRQLVAAVARAVLVLDRARSVARPIGFLGGPGGPHGPV
jgi:hypothetical protein